MYWIPSPQLDEETKNADAEVLEQKQALDTLFGG